MKCILHFSKQNSILPSARGSLNQDDWNFALPSSFNIACPGFATSASQAYCNQSRFCYVMGLLLTWMLTQDKWKKVWLILCWHSGEQQSYFKPQPTLIAIGLGSRPVTKVIAVHKELLSYQKITENTCTVGLKTIYPSDYPASLWKTTKSVYLLRRSVAYLDLICISFTM